MPVNTVQVFNVGKVGVVADQPAHTLPPEAWTSSLNIRFSEKGASSMAGESQIFGTPTVAPGFVLAVPSTNTTFWIYTSLTKAYVYEGGVHTNITRQTASVDVNYAAPTYEDWNACLLGGIPVLNNGADIPQYWATYSASQKLQALPNWPSTLRAEVVRSFGRYLVALNLLDGSTRYPHTIQWSGAADPGSVPTSWSIADATSDAGRIELTDSIGGVLKDGLMLGNQMILYKAASTHGLRYVGGNDIFASDLQLTSSGILTPRCACNIMNGRKHFVVTESDIITHSGQKDATSVCDSIVRNLIFDNLELDAVSKCFVFENPRYNEAWFCYPTSDQATVNRAAIFNYRYNEWTFREFEATAVDLGLIPITASDTWATSSDPWDTDTEFWSRPGERGIVLANPTRTQLQRLDSGSNINNQLRTSTLERRELAIVGRDRQGQPKVDYRVVKQINRILPKIRSQSQSVVEVRIGVSDEFNEEPVWTNPYTFIAGQDRWIDLDQPVSGKLISLRFSSNSTVEWSLEGYDLEMALLGNIGVPENA